MDKIPITAEGASRLRDELKTLKTVERPTVIKAIAAAREHGDLSENAEYHAAREHQSFIEGRIAELEDQESRIEIIDVKSLKGKDIMFGATVTLADEETDVEKTFQIVGEYEADPSEGRISVSSPMARAIIGRKVGDSVEVTTPGGQKDYEIVKVRYK
jgi:transcription elongation factor GreA